MARVDGTAAAAVGAGALLAYAGIKGYSIPRTLQNVIQGAPPSAQAQAAPVTTPTGPPAGTGGGGPLTALSPAASASAIAAGALRYLGHCYAFGGAPGTDGKGCWDCSSFVNWVLGHDLGFTLPGATAAGYAGTSHGPTTIEYLAWSGARTVGHSAPDALPGDLCVWQTHMGIAIGNGQMISARDPAQGTGIDNIAGDIPGELLFVRRIVIGNPNA